MRGFASRPRLRTGKLLVSLACIGAFMGACSSKDDTVVLRGTDAGGQQEPGPASTRPTAGKPLPDVTVTDAAGAEVKLRSLIGKPMVINLWNSTCGPCKRELPAFAEVSGALGEQVTFIGVNSVDTPERAASFAAQYGVRYALYGDAEANLSSALGIVTLPTTLFVHADGTIAGHSGPLDAAALRSRIAEISKA